MKKPLAFLFFYFGIVQLFGQTPTISNFSPVSGPVGAAITITGTNFNSTPANNKVFFGAAMATVTNATPTSLVVTVPVGATYQYISVTDLTTNLTAYTSKKFILTFPCGGTINASSFAPELIVAHLGTSYPSSIAIGDVDGDGRSDLVVTREGFGLVTIYRNTSVNGAISFASNADFSVGFGPQNVSIGDLDGDGRLDLAVANFSSNSISVLRNISSSGNISFETKMDFTSGSQPQSVAIHDLDKDGKPEIVSVNSDNTVNTISVFKNTSVIGNISFSAKVDYQTGVQPYNIAIGDLDGDDKADIAVACSYSVSVVSIFKNLSVAGVISLDNKVDYPSGLNPYSIAIGDLDGDDRPDLATANYSYNPPYTFSVFKNTNISGIISFDPKVDHQTGNSPRSVAMEDLDGDGRPDLATALWLDAKVSLFKNTSTSGTISLSGNVDFSTGLGTQCIAFGDLDGDGKSDIATSNNAAGTVSVLKNQTNIGLAMTSANAVTLCSGQGINIPLTSNLASTYSWVANDNPNTTGESTTLQNTGIINEVIINNTASIQTVTYTVTPTTISGGCVGTPQTVIATVHPLPTLSVTADPDTCTGGVGSVRVSVSGGVSPYLYLWSTNGTNQTISGLLPASFSVSVTDAIGCSVSASATVGVYMSTISPTLSTMPDTCSGNVGAFNSPVGGTAPYSFVWDNGSTTGQSAIGLTAGTYTMAITDKNGCTATGITTVGVYTNTIAISFNSVSASCQNADGSLTANPSGGTIPYSFAWLGGNTSQTVNNLLAGNYTVNVTDKNGCTTIDTSLIGTNNTIAVPAVCMVTVDSLSMNNVIMWDKTTFAHIDSFIVMRETSANTYSPIGAVPYDSLSSFTDTVRTKYFPNTGDPNTGTYRYKLMMVDSCGNYSQLSPFHNTIYIINNSGTFSWPQLYTIEGSSNPVANYVLLRDNISNGNWVVVSSVTGTQQTITDPQYSTYQSTASWRVETQWSISCTPSKINPEVQGYNSSRSNIYSLVNGVHEYYNNPYVSIYPNPAKSDFIVQCSLSGTHNIEICDVFGKVVYTTVLTPKQQVLSPLLSGGMYFYKITDKNIIVATGKLMIQ